MFGPVPKPENPALPETTLFLRIYCVFLVPRYASPVTVALTSIVHDSSVYPDYETEPSLLSYGSPCDPLRYMTDIIRSSLL